MVRILKMWRARGAQCVAWGMLIALLAWCMAAPSPAQESDGSIAFVNLESAIDDHLSWIGRLETYDKRHYRSFTPVRWEILSETETPVPVERWAREHSFGGIVQLRVVWKIELDAEWAKQNSAQAAEVDLNPVTTSRHNARMTQLGWQLRRPDPSESSSDVYPYSEYHSDGFNLCEVYYFTRVRGNAAIELLGSRRTYNAHAGMGFDEWSRIVAGQGAHVEFKWGASTLSRAGNLASISFVPRSARTPHYSSLVQEAGSLLTRAAQAPYETAEIVLAGFGTVRCVEAEVYTHVEPEHSSRVAVLRGEAEVYNLDGVKLARVAAGQSVALENGALAEQALAQDALEFAADEHFRMERERVGGMDILSRLRSATLSGMGVALEDFDHTGLVVDGDPKSGIGFLDRGRDLYITIDLGAVYSVQEVRVVAGAASAKEVHTTEYSVELSETGEFRGEQIAAKRGSFSGVRSAKPNLSETIPLKSVRAEYIRYRVTDAHGAASMLYELEALGIGEPVTPDARTQPWIYPRRAVDEPGLEPQIFTVGVKKEDLPKLILDGKLEGRGITIDSEQGEVVIDFGRETLMDEVRVSAQLPVKQKPDDELYFAVDLSSTGKFEGEEVRVGGGHFGYTFKVEKIAVQFKPVKARFVRYKILNAVFKSSTLYELEVLRAFYQAQEGWPLRVNARSVGAPAGQDPIAPLVTQGEVMLGVRSASVLGPDAAQELEKTYDGATDTGAFVPASAKSVVMEFNAPADLRVLEIYASPGSSTQSTRTTFVIEASATGEFAGEEVLLAEGRIEGVGSGQFDFFNRVVLDSAVTGRFVRLRPTEQTGEGFTLYELRVLGTPKEK